MSNLSALKRSILGNDKLKLELRSDQELLPRVIEALSGDTTSAGDAAVILEAFTGIAKDGGISFPENTTNELVFAALKHPEIELQCLQSLVALVGASDGTEEASSELIRLLRRVLRGGRRPELAKACEVIERISGHKTMLVLYIPLMKRVAYATAPLFRYILSANNTPDNLWSFENCTDAAVPPAQTLSPETSDTAEGIAPLLRALARVYKEVDNTQHALQLPMPLRYTLMALLRCANTSLRLAAATTLTEYTYHHTSDIKKKERTYRTLLPTLVALSQYRGDPSALKLIASICQDWTGAAPLLVSSNFADRAASQLASPKLRHLSPSAAARTADALLVLSGLCAVEDGHRDLVARYDLAPLLTDTLRRHARICSALESTNATSALGPAKAAAAVSTRLATAACYLIRSLSRSASMLRTFLVDIDPVDLLMDILQTTPHSQDDLVLRAVVLGTVANLVVEFSAVRQRFLKYDLYHMLSGFINDNSQSPGHLLLRIAALRVIRNSLYSDDTFFKTGFIREGCLNRIFELCEDPNDSVQQQCFNILRNVSVASADHSAKLAEAYQDSTARRITGDRDLLQFIKRHLDAAQSPETIVAINYVLVHFASSTMQSKLLLTQNEPLLRKLLSLLEAPIPKGPSALREKLWHLKLSIVWIVTNLTWREETGSDDEEEMDIDVSEDYTRARNRARRLIDMGFYTAIKDLNGHCEVADFKERARTAIFQLVFRNGS